MIKECGIHEQRQSVVDGDVERPNGAIHTRSRQPIDTKESTGTVKMALALC